MISIRKWHNSALLNRLRLWAIETLNGAPLSIGAPPYTAAGLLTEYIESNNKYAPVRINWHAVAVQLAKNWLRDHEPDVTTVANVEGLADTSAMLKLLDENKLAELRTPYVVMMWQGRGEECGVQVIGVRK